MIAKELLAQHLEYSRWASMKIVEAAAKLSPDVLALDRQNSFGGILGTLTHIYQADRVWSKRFQGEPYFTLAQAGDGEMTLERLATEWPPVLDQFIAWLRAQDESRFSGKLFWRNIRGEDKEETVYKILLHVVNHGTYHRGQVITMLKQAGAEVVSTDLVYYPGM